MSSQQTENDGTGESATVLGRPISTHYSASSKADGWVELEIDWETMLAPGRIKVSRVEHRRLLEEVGQADDDRIIFIGDAAEMDPPEERKAGENDG